MNVSFKTSLGGMAERRQYCGHLKLKSCTLTSEVLELCMQTFVRLATWGSAVIVVFSGIHGCVCVYEGCDECVVE